jgi:GNAT superfamily N-acetyltransferase
MNTSSAGTALRRAIGRAQRAVFSLSTMHLYACKLPLCRDDVASPKGVLISCVTDTTDSLYGSLCAQFPGRNFEARLHAGNLCFVAHVEGRVVAFAWVAHQALWIDEIELTYPVQRGELFIYDCFVDSAQRGRGIYPALISAVLQQAEGRHLALIAAMSSNPASMRGIEKTPFREHSRLRYLRCLGRRRWWSLAPRDVAPAAA